MPEQKVMCKAVFRGSVQGVGFRYTVTRLAGAYSLTGYVKNLSDGRVELVAEGTKGEVESLLRDIESRMGGYINKKEVSWSRPGSFYQDFTVRY